MPTSSTPPPNVLMVGTGEYTTGYVHGKAAQSDKSAGVVALSLFDLRAQGLVNELSMAGTNGTKYPGIRRHLEQSIAQRYRGLSTALHTFPDDSVDSDPAAYLRAMKTLNRGDAVIVFTPDDLHFEIARAAVKKGYHVLVAKPLVKSLTDHLELAAIAHEQGVLVAMEVHKRWDPIYRDARDQIRQLGHFNYFSSYMSQPKSQLATFRHWAGKSSDISYYLNAHHIDFNVWAAKDQFRPISVVATAAYGTAKEHGLETEDTITLCTTWEALDGNRQAVANYTASWIAPKSDVHSQQRFHYLGSEGEIQIDQAHRGYSLSTDQAGYRSVNPLFMKYEPNAEGRFAGQTGYGYLSIRAFIEAARSVNEGQTTSSEWNGRLATANDTVQVTAILEAGRRSLDENNRKIEICYDPQGIPVGFR